VVLTAFAVINAYKSLLILGAINRNKEITPLGKKMASLPLEPMHARTILASQEFGCTLEILDITSVLSASSKLFFDVPDEREALAEARLKFRHPSGDHMTILNVIRTYDEIEKSGNKSQRKSWCRQHFVNEKVLNEAKSIREQLRQTCERLKIDWRVSCGNEDEPVLRSLAAARCQNAALLQPDKSYRQIFGHAVSFPGPADWTGLTLYL
jgi:ATP-dependent RNA helicase DHX33